MFILDDDNQDKDTNQRGRGISGVAVGIVTRNDDPKKLGRVKITFPWESDKNETNWTKIATMSSGPDRGSMFIPEVKDQVLVAFERNDKNRPYVIGCVWDDEQKPPGPESNNTLKKIKTRSGHQVLFSDLKGEEKIEINSKSGHTIILDDNPKTNKITIHNNNKKSDFIEINSNDESITITSQKEILLKARDINIKADNTINIESGGFMTIKGARVSIN